MASTQLDPRTEPHAAPQSLVETVVATPVGDQIIASPVSERDGHSQFDFLATQAMEEPSPASTSRRILVPAVAVGVVVLAIVAFAAAASVGLLNSLSGEGGAKSLTEKVSRGNLVITVTAKGNLESANNRNIKCDVEKEGGSKIRWIVENGEKVKKGAKLVEFDKSALEEQIKQQEINLKSASALRDQAKNEYAAAEEAVKEYEGEESNFSVADDAKITLDGKACKLTDLKAEYRVKVTWERKGDQPFATRIEARLQVQKEPASSEVAAKKPLEGIIVSATAGRIAVRSGGTYQQELKTLESQVVVANENVSSAQNSREHSERMFRKGYISNLQLESQRFAVTSANIDLDKAEMAVKTLEKYTKKKMLIDLKGKLATAKTRMEAEEEKYNLEQSKLERLKDQLQRCVILAPQDGMVEYAIERNRWGGGQQTTLEVGSVIPLGRDVLRMPDLAQMQARVMVNETKVDRVKPQMRAVVKLAQGVEYEAEVEFVANQADQKSWNSAAVTEFPVVVKITEPLRGDQKPGMTVDVVITVDDSHKNVLKLPVTAAVRSGDDWLCWVKTSTGAERRPLKLRQNGDKDNPSLVTDDSFFVIEDGLVEGDEVVMNPRGTIAEAREAEQVVRQARERAAKQGKSPTGKDVKLTAERPAGKEGSKQGPSKGSGKQRSADWWKQMDKNGDGKLARNEMQGPMADRFDSMDKNSDGFVDEAEMNTAMEAFRKKFAAGAGGPPKQ